MERQKNNPSTCISDLIFQVKRTIKGDGCFHEDMKVNHLFTVKGESSPLPDGAMCRQVSGCNTSQPYRKNFLLFSTLTDINGNGTSYIICNPEHLHKIYLQPKITDFSVLLVTCVLT